MGSFHCVPELGAGFCLVWFIFLCYYWCMVILVMFCHHTNLSVTSALSCCTLSACSFSTPLLVEEVSFHQVQDSSYSTTWHWAGGQMLRCSWIINNNKKMVFYNPSLHCMVRSFFHACGKWKHFHTSCAGVFELSQWTSSFDITCCLLLKDSAVCNVYIWYMIYWPNQHI